MGPLSRSIKRLKSFLLGRIMKTTTTATTTTTITGKLHLCRFVCLKSFNILLNFVATACCSADATHSKLPCFPQEKDPRASGTGYVDRIFRSNADRQATALLSFEYLFYFYLHLLIYIFLRCKLLACQINCQSCLLLLLTLLLLLKLLLLLLLL